jgi:hypothetical protein
MKEKDKDTDRQGRRKALKRIANLVIVGAVGMATIPTSISQSGGDIPYQDYRSIYEKYSSYDKYNSYDKYVRYDREISYKDYTKTATYDSTRYYNIGRP